MKPTASERAWAGLIMFILLVLLLVVLSLFIEEGSPAARIMPMFTMSFVGLIMVVVHRPRPFLDWIRKWTKGWPRLP